MPDPTPEQIKANLKALRDQHAPEDVIDRYMQSVGAKPVGEAQAPAAPPKPEVGLVEGGVGAFGQGATLGGSDELLAGLDAFGPTGLAQSLVAGRNPLDRYREGRDAIRAKQDAFKKDHGNVALGAELAGGVAPAVLSGGLTRGLSATRAGMAFGGLTAAGHGEGDVKDQARGVAGGVFGGGILGGVLSGAAKLANKTGIPQRIADILPGGAKRQAVRAAATVVDPATVAPRLAARNALTPGSAVIGDAAPEVSALGKVLGRSPKSAVTGPATASQRVQLVKDSRKAIGRGYDDLDQPLALDDEIRGLIGLPKPAAAGPDDLGILKSTSDAMGLDAPPAPVTEMSFAELHRIRHDISKQARRATGMTKHDLYETRNAIDRWLQDRVPGLAALDAKYATTSQHLGDALRSLKSTTQGAVQGAVREGGSNARGADRPLGMWHQLNQVLKPSPAKAGEAMEDLIFNPANTQQSLSDIGAARARILGGGQPVAAPLGAGLGQLAGMAAAPQLNPNAAQAREQALQLRLQGASDESVAQQLGAVYTPDVVKFVIAATPRRVPQ